MSNEIKVGDEVYLPSQSGIKMTVAVIHGGNANVVWMHDGEMRQGTVPVAALKKAVRR